MLCFLPLLRRYRINEAIAGYPGTNTLAPLQSVLCFLALNLSNIRRYSADDIWCMDRGPGPFASLNVLPKAAWFSSYSDCANLDFTTLPH